MAYEVVDSRVVYDGRLARVRIDRVALPDGEAEREIVEHPHAVAVAALDADGSLVMVRQYRVALGRYALELPAGLQDVHGESALETAQRELAEEVGLAAETWERLTRFDNSGGWTDETTTVFLATGLTQVAVPAGFLAQAEEADMEILRLPLAEAAAHVDRGDLTDAKTVIGVLLADRRIAGTPAR